MRTLTATRILLILAGALLVFGIAPTLAQRAAIDDISDPAAHSLDRPQPPTLHAAAPAADDPWPAEYVVELEDLPDDAVPLTLVRVPDGWFMMGSPTTEQSHAESESPWHERLVVPPFYMSKYEITQAQWQTVMGYLPQGLFGDDIGPDYPVYAVSHNDAIAFINTLTTLTQEDLNLSLFGRERLMDYRLPSEALFEYAARGGEPTRFFFGDSLGCNDVAGDCATGSDAYPGNRSDYMWYVGNDDPQWIGKQEVGTRRPNAFGLYDMLGNVWEWTEDNWYDQLSAQWPLAHRPRCYVESPVPVWDCQILTQSPARRAVRGGGHFSPAYDCRSASRASVYENDRSRSDVGFRVTFKIDWFMTSWYYNQFRGGADPFQDWDPDDQAYWTWEVVEDDVTLDESDGVYVVTGDGSDAGHYSHFQRTFGDVIASADVRKTRGDSPTQAYAYGLTMRGDGTGQDYYELAIVVDGYYKIGRSQNGHYETLVGWTPSSALHTGYDAWNRLKGVAIANTVQFYANGELLHAIHDPALEQGQVGLFAVDSSSSTAPDTVQFDNVEIIYDDSQVIAPAPVYLPYVCTTTPSQPSGWFTLTEETFEPGTTSDWEMYDGAEGNGEYHWEMRGCQVYEGIASGWAVGGGSDGSRLSCGSDYPHSASSWMLYGPFRLADATLADLSFKLWINTASSDDYVFRGASTDGTHFSGYRSAGDSSGWIDRTLDLSDVPNRGDLTGQPQVWVAVLFSSDASVSTAEGAFVDNVALRKFVPAAGAGAGSDLSLSAPGADPEGLLDVPHHQVLSLTQ